MAGLKAEDIIIWSCINSCIKSNSHLALKAIYEWYPKGMYLDRRTT